MNPGIPEEAGQTARGLIDGLKESPFTLALVVMNLTILGFLYFVYHEQSLERRHDTELLYQNRKEVADLLANCYPSPNAPQR